MSRDTSIWAPPRSAATFGAWVTRSKQACFQRSKRAHPTYGAGSSFWPTPTRSVYACRAQIELSATGLKFRDDPDQTGSQFGIGQVARLWTLIHLLISSCGAVPRTGIIYLYSLPLHMSLTVGTRYSPGELTFNPNFSDWVMGWPIGWTAPTQQVTEWSAWLLRMRGELSRMPSPNE
jgi:hypothetical protein